MNVAIIPARGGSKGIKDKNIIRFAGKPLIYWTIRSAKMSKLIDKIYVSTDSTEIEKVSELYGVEVLKDLIIYQVIKLKLSMFYSFTLKAFLVLKLYFASANISLKTKWFYRRDRISKFEKSNFSNLATGSLY